MNAPARIVPMTAQVACFTKHILAGISVLISSAAAGAAEPAAARVDFNRDIRPILSDNCFLCHGPNDDDRQAGLRLDEMDSALGELDSGSTAVVPGKPDASELVRRITSQDEFERMPPPDSGKALKPAEIELLKRWIAQGAEYAGHWAFVPPARPAMPNVKLGDAAEASGATVRFCGPPVHSRNRSK